jgi:hypothetical protein
MTYVDLLVETNVSITERLKIRRIIRTERFENLYKASDEGQKDLVRMKIETGDFKGVKDWVRAQSLDEMSIRDLYKVARRLNISGYSRMNKFVLVETIKQKELTNEED